MPEVDLQRVAAVLRREEAVIARSATQLLYSQSALSEEGAEAGSSAVRLGMNEVGAGGGDETEEMASEGFRRLGRVVALSLLVDEPRLISDDIGWLVRLTGSSSLPESDPSWFKRLLTAYLQACEPFLHGDEWHALMEVVEKSLAGAPDPKSASGQYTSPPDLETDEL